MLDHTFITSQNQSLRQVGIRFSPSRGQRHEVSCPSRVLSIAPHRCHLRRGPQGRGATARGCSALSEEVRVTVVPTSSHFAQQPAPFQQLRIRESTGTLQRHMKGASSTQRSRSSNCPLLAEHPWCSRLSSEPLISML